MFVTAELLPVGILTEISTSFQQPIGKVGLIVTSYAWTVAFSAVLITIWLAPLERRKLLIIITLLFAIANIGVACAPSLLILFITRILGAFSHGVFWSTVGPLCLRLSGPVSKTRATAIVFGGIAAATVIAVPAGTLLAQWLGWRIVFASIAFTSVMITIAISLRFPHFQSESHINLHQLLQLLRHPLLRKLFPATALAITGHFCAFTYISLLLQKKIAIASTHLAFYLFIFGVAGVVGSVLASRLADYHLDRICQWIMLIMGLVIMLFAYLPTGATILVSLLIATWGAGICVLTVALQSLILTLPGKMTDVASSMYVSMFNIGIGSGALLGGLLIDHRCVQAVAWVGGIFLFIAAMIISWKH